MRAFEPDWIVSMGGGSPIDAAKAMWAFYEYPDTTFELLFSYSPLPGRGGSRAAAFVLWTGRAPCSDPLQGFVVLRRGRGGLLVFLSQSWLASITP